jgi:hypothetical protein
MNYEEFKIFNICTTAKKLTLQSDEVESMDSKISLSGFFKVSSVGSVYSPFSPELNASLTSVEVSNLGGLIE